MQSDNNYSPIIEFDYAAMNKDHCECRLAAEYRKQFSFPLNEIKEPEWDGDEEMLGFIKSIFGESCEVESIGKEVWYEAARQERIHIERSEAAFVTSINHSNLDAIKDFLWDSYGKPIDLAVVRIKRIGNRAVVFGQSVSRRSATGDVDVAVIVDQRRKSFRVQLFDEPEDVRSAIDCIEGMEWARE